MHFQNLVFKGLNNEFFVYNIFDEVISARGKYDGSLNTGGHKVLSTRKVHNKFVHEVINSWAFKHQWTNNFIFGCFDRNCKCHLKTGAYTAAKNTTHLM